MELIALMSSFAQQEHILHNLSLIFVEFRNKEIPKDSILTAVLVKTLKYNISMKLHVKILEYNFQNLTISKYNKIHKVKI